MLPFNNSYYHILTVIIIITQLPEPLCRFQELNYTILISDENGSIIAESGPYHQLVMGSELNMAGVVSHDVSSGLLRNEEYSLNVILFTFACESTSDSYYFGIIIVKVVLCTIISLKV